MAKETKKYDIDEYRRQKKRKKWIHKTVLAGSLLLLAALVAFGFYMVQNYDIETLLTGEETDNEGTLTDLSFPVTLTGLRPVGISSLGREIVLLTDEESAFFSASGSALRSFAHRYTNPVQKTAEDRVLTYDRGGYSYRVDSSGSLLYSARLTDTILTGAISRKNQFALVTSASGYAGCITVFDSSGKEKVKWYSASESIVDIDFSYDGDSLVIACAGFEGGTVYTRIYQFSLKSGETEERIASFSDSIPLAVDCKKGDVIHVICDNRLGIIGEQQDVSQISFDSALLRYCFTDEKTVFLLSDASQISVSLNSVDVSGETLTAVTKGEIIDVATDGQTVYLLQKGSVLCYDASLLETAVLTVDAEVFDIETVGGQLYLLGSNRLTLWEEKTDDGSDF